MRTRMRWLMGAALALLLSPGWAQAAGVNDSLTITITPNAGYSVMITTANVGMDLGTVSLGASTQTVRPSTVTVTSSYATTGLKMTGSMSGLGTQWTYSINTAAQAQDELAAWAVFTDTSVADYAVLGATGTGSNYFVGTTSGVANSNVVGTLQAQVGTGAGPTHFIANAGQAGRKTMASLPTLAADAAAAKAHLWFYFVLPPATTDNFSKLMTFTIAAGAPN